MESEKTLRSTPRKCGVGEETFTETQKWENWYKNISALTTPLWIFGESVVGIMAKMRAEKTFPPG